MGKKSDGKENHASLSVELTFGVGLKGCRISAGGAGGKVSVEAGQVNAMSVRQK